MALSAARSTSNITIVGVTFFIVTAVVVPVELLRRHHLAELRKDLGAKMDNVGKAWVASIEEQFAKMRAAQVPGKGVGSK